MQEEKLIVLVVGETSRVAALRELLSAQFHDVILISSDQFTAKMLEAPILLGTPFHDVASIDFGELPGRLQLRPRAEVPHNFMARFQSEPDRLQELRHDSGNLEALLRGLPSFEELEAPEGFPLRIFPDRDLARMSKVDIFIRTTTDDKPRSIHRFSPPKSTLPPRAPRIDHRSQQLSRLSGDHRRARTLNC